MEFIVHRYKHRLLQEKTEKLEKLFEFRSIHFKIQLFKVIELVAYFLPLPLFQVLY